jgi:hypothetical protein
VLREIAMAALHRSERLNASKLTVHRPEDEPMPAPRDVVYWRVNGYRAAMLVWTDDEFARLSDGERPADAQHFSCGIWAVLRMI